MGDDTAVTMNLDLNLGPGPEGGSGSVTSEALNLDELIGDPIEQIREAVRIRARQRRRFRLREPQTLTVELNQLMGDSGNVSTLQAGEGSVAAEDRTNELPKICENGNGILEDDVSEKKGDVEKVYDNDGSFYDCNICFDLATDPVVTCCGHLFCWPCLYQWLNVHSDAKECPVCKGEVTIKSVTPIYGRGSNARKPEADSNLEIPVRPHASRVESLRQTIHRNPFSFPVEEMIRRLGSRFDLIRDLTVSQEPNGARESAERNHSLLNRLMTFRGIRGEQNPATDHDELVDLIHNGASNPELEHVRRLNSLLLRRSHSHSHRSSTHSSLSALTSTERLVDPSFRHNPAGRNQEPSQPVDDRDSFSSIAAVINSESQMDTAAEIDSMVSLSTSSSRRRNDASRVSDVDTGDSRAPRRRRLN